MKYIIFFIAIFYLLKYFFRLKKLFYSFKNPNIKPQNKESEKIISKNIVDAEFEDMH